MSDAVARVVVFLVKYLAIGMDDKIYKKLLGTLRKKTWFQQREYTRKVNSLKTT